MKLSAGEPGWLRGRAPSPGSRWRAPSSRFVDRVTAGFALWTVGFHASVLVGLSLGYLVIATTVVGLGLLALQVVTARRERAELPVAERDAEAPLDRRLWLWLGGALFVGAFGLAPVGAEAKWMALAIYCLTACLATARSWLRGVDGEVWANESEAEGFVWALALIGGALAVAMLEPGPDDSATLNFAVVVADAPWAPPLQHDQLHGQPGLPVLMNLYRLESLPAACGALAWLLGIPAKLVVHRLLPFLMGFLCVLVHARLARRLGGHVWQSLFVCLAVLLFVTDWSPFSFMPIVHYGKIALFLVVTPLLVCYAVEFSAGRFRGAWRRLAGAQVAALGLSTTAVWAAPLIPAATLLAFWAPGHRGAQRLLLGIGASSYVLAIGLLFVALSLRPVDVLPELTDAPAERSLWVDSLTLAARSPRLRWVAFSAVALALPLAPGRVAQRVLLGLAIGCLLVLVNPWLASWVASTVTGHTTYWRTFLAFPAHLAIGFVAVSPMVWQGARRAPARSGWRLALTALVLTIAVSISPRVLRWPAIDAFETSPYRDEYAAAARIVELAKPGEAVLAPEEVARWTTTFHRPPYPLVVRRVYLNVLSAQLTADELHRRLVLEDYVAGDRREARAASLLASSLRDREVGIVAFARSAEWHVEVREILSRAGMRRDGATGPVEIWIDDGAGSVRPEGVPSG